MRKKTSKSPWIFSLVILLIVLLYSGGLIGGVSTKDDPTDSSTQINSSSSADSPTLSSADSEANSSIGSESHHSMGSEPDTSTDSQTSRQSSTTNLATATLPSGKTEIILNRVGYTCSYNTDLLLPNWVGWTLSAEHTEGPYKRSGIPFHEDPDVSAPRVTTYDYSGSGYDRGHMCPSGDCRWSEEAQQQSFLMTNICPQNHNLNCGDWNELEIACRRWALRYGEIHIVCGPLLFNKQHKTIGKHKVTVPEAFYKVILRLTDEPEAIGFIFRNESGNKKINSYVHSVDEVERITGMNFFPNLQQPIQDDVESRCDITQWN